MMKKHIQLLPEVANKLGIVQEKWHNVNPSTVVVAPQRQAPPPVKLVEGCETFAALDTGGFGSASVVVCRRNGTVNGSVASSDIQVKGVRNCYVLEDNETIVDIGALEANPHKCTRLVEIRGVFGRPFLVRESAIVGTVASRTVLFD